LYQFSTSTGGTHTRRERARVAVIEDLATASVLAPEDSRKERSLGSLGIQKNKAIGILKNIITQKRTELWIPGLCFLRDLAEYE